MRSARPSSLIKYLRSYLLPALLVVASTAHAMEFVVDTEQDLVDSNPGDGICNTVAASCSLRGAIMEANALAGADTILLDEGTFSLTISGANDADPSTGDLNITDDLTIQGAGSLTSIVAATTYRAFTINISTEGYAPRVNFADLSITQGPASTQGAHIYNESVLSLNGVTLGDGASGSSLIYVPDVATTATDINNSVFTSGDGALVIESGSLRISASSFSEFTNTALLYAADDGELRISDSDFTNNRCANTCNGAAINILAAKRSFIETSTFDGNYAQGDGGALYAADGFNNYLQSLQFTSNEATGNGGGVYTTATTSLSSSLFKTNSANNGGALYIAESSQTLFYKFSSQILASAMLENTASELGGGIYVVANSLLANLTIGANVAGIRGGGIYVASGTSLQPHLIHNTLAYNQAAAGKAANVSLAAGGKLFLARNLLASPNSGSVNCDVPLGNVIDGLYTVDNLSDVNDCDASASVSDVGPVAQMKLGSLDSGGAIPFYPLLTGSAAINFASGSATACINNLDQTGSSLDPDYFKINTDLRWHTRGTTCDVGAIEYNSTAANAGQLEISVLESTTPEESTGQLNFEVNRLSGSDGMISVAIFSDLPSEARLLTDFDFADGGIIRFLDGDTSPKTFTLNIINDDIDEDNESFSIELVAATGGAQLYANSRRLISIVDDDEPDFLQFSFVNVSANEDSGSVQLKVRRVGSGEGSLSAEYQIVTDGLVSPAEAGIDYVSADSAGTVLFAPGELGEKIIAIGLIDNDQLDYDKVFEVELSGSAVKQGQGNRASVVIQDDEKTRSAGVFNFASESRNVSVSEFSRYIDLKIVRENVIADETAYVSVQTNDITAIRDEDYRFSAAELSFPKGVSELSYRIQIIDDSVYTGERAFEVHLSKNLPADATALGQYTIATVTIEDNEANPADVGGIVIGPPKGEINIKSNNERVNRDDSSGSFGLPFALIMLMLMILRHRKIVFQPSPFHQQ